VGAGASGSPDLRAAADAKTGLLVGIVGRIQPYKGHEDLVFALSRLDPDVRARLKLLIIGSGDSAEMARLQRLADRLGVRDQVRFPGYLPGDPVDLIAQLDLLVIATRSFEGFGLTLAEAFLAGTPILTTRVGAIPEFVNETNGVLVNPGSPQEIADALESFVVNPDAWRARAEYARKNPVHTGIRMSHEYHRLLLECVAEIPD
jgi:glycosyltransferase involved in cell wall biosynthesis